MSELYGDSGKKLRDVSFFRDVVMVEDRDELSQ